MRWRATDAANWQHDLRLIEDDVDRSPSLGCLMENRIPIPDWPLGTCRAVLKGVRVDDWVFGVSSVSKDGYESPVASAVPGGAFMPYVPPPPPPAQ